MLAIAVTGCTSFELTRPAVAPASIDLRIDVTHDSASDYHARALLLNGRDTNGNEFQIRDSALYIDGVAVRPTPGSVRATVEYEWERSLGMAATTPTALTVAMPVVGSWQQTSFLIQLPAREDPRDIDVDANGDVRLRITPLVDPASFELLSARWDLIIRSSCAQSGPQLLSLFGTSRYQSEIRFPRDLIGQTNASELSACFRAEATYRRSEADVRETLIVSLDIRWRIRL